MNKDMFLFYKSALSGEITTPLCAEYKKSWRLCGDNKEMLVRLVLKEQSLPFFFAHCYQNKGLSKEYILSEFKDFVNGGYTGMDVDGVAGDYKSELYVGFNDSLDKPLDVVSFQWCNITPYTIPSCKATKMYVGCGSKVHVECEGFNSVVVMLFDDSEVFLDDVDADSNVIVYRYSKDAKVELGKYCLGKVKVFEKQLKL